MLNTITAEGGQPCNFNSVAMDAEFIALEDMSKEKGGISITNAVNEVCKFCKEFAPGRRIFYKDSIGEWSEIETSDEGNFIKFSPINDAHRMGVLAQRILESSGEQGT